MKRSSQVKSSQVKSPVKMQVLAADGGGHQGRASQKASSFIVSPSPLTFTFTSSSVPFPSIFFYFFFLLPPLIFYILSLTTS
jgi:hypothetical protein